PNQRWLSPSGTAILLRQPRIPEHNICMTAEELQAHLFALEERLVHPDREVDRSNLVPLLADDFKEFGCSGRVYHRSQILDILTTTHPRSATISHFSIEPLAESAVLATYHLTSPTSVP